MRSADGPLEKLLRLLRRRPWMLFFCSEGAGHGLPCSHCIYWSRPAQRGGELSLICILRFDN
jgi:hypothetical protein